MEQHERLMAARITTSAVLRGSAAKIGVHHVHILQPHSLLPAAAHLRTPELAGQPADAARELTLRRSVFL